MVSGELAGAGLDVFMNAPEPTLTSRTRAAGALGDLLAHDRGGDERDRLDGAGHVAQGVELAVGGRQARTRRRRSTAPTSSSWASISVVGEAGTPAGDRLELVEGAAGVPEPAARQLRHGDAAGRHERREREGDLVADAAGGVLVGGRAGRATEKSIRSPRGDHRRRPAGDLAAGHPVEQDRHGQRRHLLVGDDAAGVGVDRPSRSARRSARPPSRLAMMTSTASKASLTQPCITDGRTGSRRPGGCRQDRPLGGRPVRRPAAAPRPWAGRPRGS